MFTALRRLHYGSPRRSIEGAARQPVRLSEKDDGVEFDELLLVFYLRDDQREVLILEVASGLSYEEAAEVCDCEIDTFRSRLLDAKRAISRIWREASRKEVNFATPLKSEYTATRRCHLRRVRARVDGAAQHDPRQTLTWDHSR